MKGAGGRISPPILSAPVTFLKKTRALLSYMKGKKAKYSHRKNQLLNDDVTYTTNEIESTIYVCIGSLMQS